MYSVSGMSREKGWSMRIVLKLVLMLVALISLCAWYYYPLFAEKLSVFRKGDKLAEKISGLYGLRKLEHVKQHLEIEPGDYTSHSQFPRFVRDKNWAIPRD